MDARPKGIATSPPKGARCATGAGGPGASSQNVKLCSGFFRRGGGDHPSRGWQKKRPPSAARGGATGPCAAARTSALPFPWVGGRKEAFGREHKRRLGESSGLISGSRRAVTLEEDVQKLQQRIKDAQERLKDGRAALSAVSEKKAAENLLAEARVAKSGAALDRGLSVSVSILEIAWSVVRTWVRPCGPYATLANHTRRMGPRPACIRLCP